LNIFKINVDNALLNVSTQDRYTTDCTVPKSILFYAFCKMSNVFIGPSHSLRFMALVLTSLLLKTDFMKLVT